MGMFYHAALIMRRGDVAKAKRTIAVVTDPVRSRERAAFLNDVEAPLNWYLHKRFDRMAPCYYGMAEVSRIGTCLGAPDNVDQVFTEPQWPMDITKQEVLSDTGELYRNWKDNYGWIDTPMTKCVYGFLQKNGKLTLNDVEVDCDNDFAVIAMSSLTNDPINNSNNILLTTGGRSRNHNAKFDGDVMLEWGENPTEIEVIHATIRIKTNHSRMRVISLAPEGMYQGFLDTTYEDGVLSFTVGEKWRSMYYLIQEY